MSVEFEGAERLAATLREAAEQLDDLTQLHQELGDVIVRAAGPLPPAAPEHSPPPPPRSRANTPPSPPTPCATPRSSTRSTTPGWKPPAIKPPPRSSPLPRNTSKPPSTPSKESRT